jgi:hypothetical protein
MPSASKTVMTKIPAKLSLEQAQHVLASVPNRVDPARHGDRGR